MAWLNTIPPGSKDPNKKLYIYWYDKNLRRTVKRVTKYYNRYPDKAEARKFLKRFEQMLAEDKFRADFMFEEKRLKFSEAFELFIKSRLVKRKTITSYYCAANKFIEILGDYPLHYYTKQICIDFIKTMQNQSLSANTISSYTKQLSVIFNYFVEEELLNKNPIRTLPRIRIIPKIITENDLKKIFDYLKRNPKHYYIAKLLYLTGFRPSTLAKLKTEDINFEAGYITYWNEKENKTALFPLHHELRELLTEMKLPGSGQIIENFNTTFWKRGINALYSSGMIKEKYSLKLLRKTFATKIAITISEDAAALLLDHESKKITKESYIAKQMKESAFYYTAIEQLRRQIDERTKF